MWHHGDFSVHRFHNLRPSGYRDLSDYHCPKACTHTYLSSLFDSQFPNNSAFLCLSSYAIIPFSL